MRPGILILLFSLLIVTNWSEVAAQASNSESEAIRKALLYQKENYPASQYRDVYKNFMQDFYGPGHILKDKQTASRGIKGEMSNVKYYDGPDFEPTGFQGNFYRVNLRLIAENVIPYETYLNAFVESVQGIVPPEPDEWMETWNKIDNEISNIGWTFENEDKDRTDLYAQFREGNFIVHHSHAYNESVNFHYRIISRDNFEKIILPLLTRMD